MYSRTRPFGRDQIFAGFEAVLVELAGCPAGPAQLVTSVENAGAEFLGYSAPQETFRIVAGSLALTCTIDPILASMGVSGEDHVWIGSGLPLTHFLRIVRGVLLKGSGPADIAPELWPLLLFLAVAMAIGVKRYRQTLD